jgi:hypothetical protein
MKGIEYVYKPVLVGVYRADGFLTLAERGEVRV